ncbi:MAG: COX15/CtaA family protein [Cycloclasticus sp.]
MILQRLSLFGILLALFVVILGAYVRLSDAGLGCPDWPGCYGSLIVDDSQQGIHAAAKSFPERPLESSKAWKEMTHRYFASALGFVILLLTYFAWRQPQLGQRGLTLSLLILVLFQGALGMWTVTLLVKPVIVMGHLLGGLSILSLLFLLLLRLANKRLPTIKNNPVLKVLAPAALLVLVLQIALGGWTSTNYAALACPELPTCLDESWQPDVDYQEGFVLWRGLGVDYEYGVLTNQARAAIHWVHRIGAVVTTVLLTLLAFLLFRIGAKTEVKLLLGCLFSQLLLGVLNVVFSLPLPLAVAHNGVAALLLLSVVYLNFRLNSYKLS